MKEQVISINTTGSLSNTWYAFYRDAPISHSELNPVAFFIFGCKIFGCKQNVNIGWQMSRRVFFSFHYERDVWRAGQVRNSWVTKDRETAGFYDSASWEAVKRQGDDAVKRWITRELENTSVTVVLIGTETSQREYVGYEIQQSVSRGNGLLGVYIHNLKDQRSLTDTRGGNPFDNWQIPKNGVQILLSQMYPVYDWINDSGRFYFSDWIEKAAQQAGR